MLDLFEYDLNQETIYQLAMLIPLLLQIMGMVFAVLVDSYISKSQCLQ